MNNEEKILEMLAEISKGQAEFKEEVNKRFDNIESRLEELDARSLKSAVLLETDIPRDINRLYEAREEIVRKLDTLATKEQAEELSSDVDAIKIVVSRHSGDISKLKKAQ